VSLTLAGPNGGHRDHFVTSSDVRRRGREERPDNRRRLSPTREQLVVVERFVTLTGPERWRLGAEQPGAKVGRRPSSPAVGAAAMFSRVIVLSGQRGSGQS
jgi:hypothetical protein